MTQPAPLTREQLAALPPPPPPTPVVTCPLCGSVYEPSNAKVHQEFHDSPEQKGRKWPAQALRPVEPARVDPPRYGPLR